MVEAALNAVEGELKARGWRALRLNVFSWNAAAWRLYERAGYEIIERHPSGAHFAKRI